LELRSILNIFLSRWWLVLIPTIIAAIFAAPDILNRTAVSGGYSAQISYTAFQDMEAIPRETGDYQDLWLSSELLVNALTDWVPSSSFKAEISALSGETVDVTALGIQADNERSVGQIFLSYPDAAALNAAVEAAIRVLETTNSDYFPQLGGTPASVRVLNFNEATASAPSLPNRFAPFLKIGLGFLAGLGLATLAYYLDPFVRRRSEIELLGLPVLATLSKR
jgi:capsular polysaccharide biosynthesis protein